MARRRAPYALVLALTTLALSAMGQTADTVPGEVERARELYHQGNESYAAGNYQAALEAFAAADAIMGVPTTALGLGKAQAQLGLLVEAHRTLLRASQYPPTDGESSSFTEARGEAAALAPQVEARVPVVNLAVSGVTAGTLLTIRVDGTRVGESPETLHEWKLNPGAHRVTVAAPGYRTGTAGFSLAEGEKKELAIALVKAPRPAPPAPHEVAGGNDGAWIAAGVAFGLGAAGMIAGAITGGMSLSLASDVDAACGDDDTCPESVRPDHDRTITLANASNVGFAVGGGGIAAGIIAVIVAATREDSSEQSLIPYGAGLEVRF